MSQDPILEFNAAKSVLDETLKNLPQKISALVGAAQKAQQKHDNIEAELIRFAIMEIHNMLDTCSTPKEKLTELKTRLKNI